MHCRGNAGAPRVPALAQAGENISFSVSDPCDNIQIFAGIFMAKTKTIFDDIDEDAEARAIEEAEADVAAGRIVPHEEVVKWLRSWGTPNELPCPIPKVW
jgi:hypothetical protein